MIFRVCKNCLCEHIPTADVWPMSGGAPHGRLCKICYNEAVRKRYAVRYNTDPVYKTKLLERGSKYKRDRYTSDPEYRKLQIRKAITCARNTPEKLLKDRIRVRNNKRKYVLVPGKREEYNASNRVYSKNNTHKRAANVAVYRCRKISRTPSYLTDDDLSQIKSMYALAKILTAVTGVAHHVDHIIPLSGVFVSGLHAPHNLQVLSARENILKSNTFLGHVDGHLIG